MIKSLLKFAFTVVVLVIIGVLFYFFYYQKNWDTTQTDEGAKEYIKVSVVIDGDTFKMSDGEKVRLLGIDAPEKNESEKLERDAEQKGQDKETVKRLGQMAGKYVQNLVEGKMVYLVKEPNYEDEDKYGRLLRWVYLEDGTFVNGKIIRDGYARVFEKYPVSKTGELRNYQREARENGRGLWGDIEGLKQFK